ncbi:hypothetical protein BpHYR1_029168 [Brachionus plicatilis]|uniref:Uncharacterized protein n=1 Tax=Brachionus plicatilis TaxID=10195 RepID=A0A3M7RN55_BRAPC|nr:hypothetical protein BpHYR1_029168 [Brachionus plicatilis]
MLSAHNEHSGLLKAMHDLQTRSPKQFQHKLNAVSEQIFGLHNDIKMPKFNKRINKIVKYMIEQLDHPTLLNI